MKFMRRVILSPALVLAWAGLTLGSSPALAASMIEIAPGDVEMGIQAGWLQCPCFRWTVQVQLVGGQWETRHFLISSDALLKLKESQDFQMGALTSRLVTVGAIEALWKGGHIGLSFEGVTLGNDTDRGYSDVLRTGLAALINIVRTDAIRLDIRSGYEFEKFRVNLGEPMEHQSLPQSVDFQWKGEKWSGDIHATIALDAEAPFSGEHTHYEAGVTFHRKLFNLGDLLFGAGLDLSFEHDPVRPDFGLSANQLSGVLYMDLSWVGGNSEGKTP